ncbi:hypothetical protein QJS04_geneDACA011779 [Acorus gramineus]|uniref:Uncharacterized protein n=1 Tax=Acorus gramineus TaxID=55184 RepID=A0AAV9BJP6_ACOGR|nr:hypothetical protein QJS04_geneDACA011779 [Acorus gramineus]
MQVVGGGGSIKIQEVCLSKANNLGRMEKMSGATIFNLSLLTSDMWEIIICVFFYKQKVDWLYYLSFGVVTIGMVIYSLNETNSDLARVVEVGNMSIRYEPINKDNSPVGAEVFSTESVFTRPS